MKPMNKTADNAPTKVNQLTQVALVAALYVALTLGFAPLSFGVVQLRFSELFNYFALSSKRYVWGITLGVVIANFFSPNGWLDVVVGSCGTFIFLTLSRVLTKKITSIKLKMGVMALLFTFSMFTVAGELTLLYQAPFFYNWGVIALGELLSMTVGGIIFYPVSQKLGLFKNK